MHPWQDLLNEIQGKWAWLLFLSAFACLCFVGMTFFQFIKCLLTKNTTSLSKPFTILLPITNSLITIYDIIIFVLVFRFSEKFDWVILVAVIFNGLISAYGTMILKIKHINAAKKLGITEIEYFEKYLKPWAKIQPKKK